MRNQTTLALPTDWGTTAWAAEVLNLSQRQVQRYIKSGVLTSQRPLIGSRETGRRHVIVSVSEVQALKLARQAMATPVGGPVDNCDAATDRGRPRLPRRRSI